MIHISGTKNTKYLSAQWTSDFPQLKMAQNLTMLVAESNSSNNSTTNSNENNNSSNTPVNFKPKDTNGWKDYKKLKTYLILKDQQSEKVTWLRLHNRWYRW